jgi:hypothetical protein
MAARRPWTATKRTGPTESVESIRPDLVEVADDVCGHARQLPNKIESATHTARKIVHFIALSIFAAFSRTSALFLRQAAEDPSRSLLSFSTRGQQSPRRSVPSLGEKETEQLAFSIRTGSALRTEDAASRFRPDSTPFPEWCRRSGRQRYSSPGNQYTRPGWPGSRG